MNFLKNLQKKLLFLFLSREFFPEEYKFLSKLSVRNMNESMDHSFGLGPSGSNANSYVPSVSTISQEDGKTKVV